MITLQQGIPIEAAKDIVKHLKDLKLKGAGGDPGRASAGHVGVERQLQDAMQALRAKDFGVALQFGNYR